MNFDIKIYEEWKFRFEIHIAICGNPGNPGNPERENSPQLTLKLSTMKLIWPEPFNGRMFD